MRVYPHSILVCPLSKLGFNIAHPVNSISYLIQTSPPNKLFSPPINIFFSPSRWAWHDLIFSFSYQIINQKNNISQVEVWELPFFLNSKDPHAWIHLITIKYTVSQWKNFQSGSKLRRYFDIWFLCCIVIFTLSESHAIYFKVIMNNILSFFVINKNEQLWYGLNENIKIEYAPHFLLKIQTILTHTLLHFIACRLCSIGLAIHCNSKSINC